MANMVIDLKMDPEALALLKRIADALDKHCHSEGPAVAVESPVDEVPAVEVPAVKAPEVTEASIRQRVVQLSASGKKDAVREIVKAYAPSVSGIPADKYAEVWAKLETLGD